MKRLRFSEEQIIGVPEEAEEGTSPSKTHRPDEIIGRLREAELFCGRRPFA